MYTNVAYPVLGTYLLLVLGAGVLGAVQYFIAGRTSQDKASGGGCCRGAQQQLPQEGAAVGRRPAGAS